MLKMLTILAIMLILVIAILFLFSPEERLNIPVIKDIRHWFEHNRIKGYGAVFGIEIILIIILFMC